MASLAKALWSSTGKKVILAITGLAMVLFLITHLAGNLLLYLGPDTFNAYSEALLSNPLIYIVQVGLILIFIGHIGTAIANWRRNRQARPERYQARQWAGHTSRKSLASTAMLISGVVILVFVPLHLGTFKFGPYYEADGMRDLHTLVIETFQKPGYVIWYVLALVIVGMHLWHGVSSAFQSMGADHPRYTPFIRKAGWVLAVLLTVGFITIPVLVYLRVV